MPGPNRLWSMYDGVILRPDLSGNPPPKSYTGLETTSPQASAQRSFSSSSSSSDSSASSDCPLVPEKEKFKVPLHVAATLAHRGFDVDDSGEVTWRGHSSLHPRNWSTLRKLYDVSTQDLILHLASFKSTDGVILWTDCSDRLPGSVHNTSQQYRFLNSSRRSCRSRREQRNRTNLLHNHLSAGSGLWWTHIATYRRDFRWSDFVHYRCHGFHRRMCLNGCQSDFASGDCRPHHLWLYVCFTEYCRRQQFREHVRLSLEDLGIQYMDCICCRCSGHRTCCCDVHKHVVARMVSCLAPCIRRRQLTLSQAMGLQPICCGVWLLSSSQLIDEGIPAIFHHTPRDQSHCTRIRIRRPVL